LALAAAVVAPPVARAESDEGGLLLGLWRREMGAVLAYTTALHASPLFALLRARATHHSAAIATQLAAVGLGTPPPPEAVEDLDFAAERLARAGTLDAALVLEEDLREIYRTGLPALPDAKIAMTAATILASHSQHVLILEREIDQDPQASS
jgi:hypothetical protein